MNQLNKFFHVGNVFYGEKEKVELDFFDDRIIKKVEFDCPCVTYEISKDNKSILATFVGNEKPKQGNYYNKIITLTINFENGETETFDLLLLIENRTSYDN